MDDMEKRLEYYKNHVLGPKDTFNFSCSACGKCCRKREDPIILSAPDVFRLSQYLNKTCDEVIGNYCTWHIGGQSRLPVILLKEKVNGSCVFLHHNECSVHDVFLTNCRIYPLGRMVNFKSSMDELLEDQVPEEPSRIKFEYFTQPIEAECGTDKTWTLEEYLNQFNTHQYDEDGVAWFQVLEHMIKTYHGKLENEEVRHVFSKLAMLFMYIHFDIQRGYAEQAKENIAILDKMMQTKSGQAILKINEINKRCREQGRYAELGDILND